MTDGRFEIFFPRVILFNDQPGLKIAQVHAGGYKERRKK